MKNQKATLTVKTIASCALLAAISIVMAVCSALPHRTVSAGLRISSRYFLQVCCSAP